MAERRRKAGAQKAVQAKKGQRASVGALLCDEPSRVLGDDFFAACGRPDWKTAATVVPASFLDCISFINAVRQKEIGIVEGVNAGRRMDEPRRRLLQSHCPPQSTILRSGSENRQLQGDDAEGAYDSSKSENNQSNNKPGTTRQTGEMDARGEAVEGRRGAEGGANLSVSRLSIMLNGSGRANTIKSSAEGREKEGKRGKKKDAKARPRLCAALTVVSLVVDPDRSSFDSRAGR